jgi:hypothetical protein
MAVASVSFSFVPNTLIQASQANTNFADLVTFLNSSTMHRDASAAFTAVPSGPALDPTSANQLARKSYVDKTRLLAQQVETSGGAALGPGPVNTDFVLTPVTVDVARAYEVHCHGRLDFSAVSEWQTNLTVDGATTHRLSQNNITGGDSQQMVSGSPVLWLPASGTYTLRVSVTRVSGAGTVTFLATATAPRQFYVKDIGPR